MVNDMKLKCNMIKDKSWCVDQYINKNKAVIQIRRETGLGTNTIKRWFKFHEIIIVNRDDLKGKSKENHPGWKGQKRNNGYKYVYFPEHPNAGLAGYVSEHRMIASKIIGRKLTKKDIVHHIDGNRLNNNPSNLFITDNKGHSYAHASLMTIGYYLLKNNKITFKEGNYWWI